MNYQSALDLIFESFIAAKPLIKGKLDKDVRNPELLLNVAAQNDLLPKPENVIKVTGSKGKGTVSRLIAHGLQDYFQTAKIGLIISPEEIDHTDRMRINGHAISKEQFVKCFEKIWKILPPVRAPQYYSPYGLFFLIALQWFKDEGVDHFVIECGRGVKFDEGGQLRSILGVVTSIFVEHPEYLGATLEEIRADKMSISLTSKETILGQGLQAPDGSRPAWYATSQKLAHEAIEKYVKASVVLPDGECASFARTTFNDIKIYCEGLISPESADEVFLRKMGQQGSVFILSLSDEKDVAGVCELIADYPCYHIIMTGERGYLSYEKARKYQVIYEGAYDDPKTLREQLDLSAFKSVYFIGTQTFLRLVKQAYFS